MAYFKTIWIQPNLVLISINQNLAKKSTNQNLAKKEKKRLNDFTFNLLILFLVETGGLVYLAPSMTNKGVKCSLTNFKVFPFSELKLETTS